MFCQTLLYIRLSYFTRTSTYLHWVPIYLNLTWFMATKFIPDFFPSFFSLLAENYRCPWYIKIYESSHFSSYKPQIKNESYTRLKCGEVGRRHSIKIHNSWILVWHVSCVEFTPNSFNVLKIVWLIEKLFSVRRFLEVFFAPVNI
jgi:hypothetical protein